MNNKSMSCLYGRGFLVFIIWLLAGLSGLAPVGQALALDISPNTVTIPVGGQATVTVTNRDGTVTAISSAPAVASVTYASGRATITGLSVGTATVTIRDSEDRRRVTVTVTPAISVSPASVSVPVGGNAAVSVTNANGTVTATSSNTAIATVSYAAGTATIHGVAAGTATITIRDSFNSRTVAVTVSSGAALTVSASQVFITVGSDAHVSVTNASGTVTATSSNTVIATVTYASGTATIHGVAPGTATITIRDSLNRRTVTVTVVAATTTSGNFTLLAWNNLGMHCFDGVDYSIFSILPPLNTVNAQLKNKAGALVTSGVTLTYQATADTTGSINTISSTKTNFWQYVQALFGFALVPDVGLLGYPMASNTPAAMTYNATRNWFEAVGIPITNHDDAGVQNEYPMVQVVAKNAAGQVLATTKVVLPVSDELQCKACHTSNNGSNAAANAARPAAGWVFDPDPLKDWKKNILRLHDEKQAGNVAFTSALQTAGYHNGLFNSAAAGKPVLCVACHVSNAYQIEAGIATGLTGISSLTSALHTLHGTQVDPLNGMTLNNENNRTACYMCHPGSATQCLRGAMSGTSYQCQSCHGNMANVGKTTRSGWLTMPACQSCHNNRQRALNALDASGNPLAVTDQTFATTPNMPSTGFNLYRFSTGHGGMKCSACHGSTHAEFPSTEPNDNVQSIAAQGHAGTIHECTACHVTVPNTTNGGPHGMHTIGNAWLGNHEPETTSQRAACAYCHGADFRGTFLSQVKVAKTFNADGRIVSYTAGQQVGCYDCHNGPSGALESDTRFASDIQTGIIKLASDFWSYISKLPGVLMSVFGATSTGG